MEGVALEERVVGVGIESEKTGETEGSLSRGVDKFRPPGRGRWVDSVGRAWPVAGAVHLEEADMHPKSCQNFKDT